jgi:hypothetical protein
MHGSQGAANANISQTINCTFTTDEFAIYPEVPPEEGAAKLQCVQMNSLLYEE